MPYPITKYDPATGEITGSFSVAGREARDLLLAQAGYLLGESDPGTECVDIVADPDVVVAKAALDGSIFSIASSAFRVNLNEECNITLIDPNARIQFDLDVETGDLPYSKSFLAGNAGLWTWRASALCRTAIVGSKGCDGAPYSPVDYILAESSPETPFGDPAADALTVILSFADPGEVPITNISEAEDAIRLLAAQVAIIQIGNTPF